MDRETLMQFIAEVYGTDAEYPWEKYPAYAVFRHRDNRKWFALLMRIPGARLGRKEQAVEVLNLKCDPIMLGSLLAEEGIYPAYHMSKTNWISVLPDIVPADRVKWLLDLSFDLTAYHGRKAAPRGE